MNRKKKIIVALSAILLVFGGIISYILLNYNFYDGYKKILEPTVSAAEGTDFQPIKEGEPDVNGMVLAAENERFKLYTDVDSTKIALVDKASKMTTYSNPVDAEVDPVANNHSLNELQSQITIDYYDSNRNRVKINNYELSILRDQYEIEQLENGIRYIYNIADHDSETGIVPVYIAEDYLEEKVLSQLDEAEARDVRTKYLISPEDENLLILTDSAISSQIRVNRLNELFEKAGFTQADFDELLEEEGGESDRVNITIAIDYRLTDSGLNVTIPFELLEESGGVSIASIEVLKYFGAQGTETEGYMFVPNGSGSLIYLNNEKNGSAYSQYVYDMDVPSKSYISTENREIARLPIFGIKNDMGAMLAVINAGDSVSQINADVAGKLNSYNYVYPSYSLRGNELLSMFGASGSSADLPIVEKDMYDISFSIDYHLLPGEEVGYSEMAKLYQELLFGEQADFAREEIESLPFYLDIVGGVQKQQEVLGVPYNSMEVMTSFEESEQIVKELMNEDVSNIRLNYLGWFNGGYYHHVPDRIKNVNKLGGKKDLENLTTTVEETGGKVYGNVAFQQVPSTSKNYMLELESSKYYSGLAVVRGKVNPSTVRETSSLGYDEAIYSILSPKFLNRYVDKFTDSITDYPLSGVALRDLGAVLSSDKKRTEVIHRENAKQLVIEAFEQLADTDKKVMVASGNAYSLPFAEDVLDVPMGGSDFPIIDEHIPFYQMILNGIVNYTSEPINHAGVTDEDALLLDVIETGGAPRYVFSYEDAVEIKYTSMNHLYSTQYETWFEHAASLYNRSNEVMKPVLNSSIAKHEIVGENVRKVTYENGIVFYVNRSAESQVVDGIRIPAMQFVQTEEVL